MIYQITLLLLLATSIPLPSIEALSQLKLASYSYNSSSRKPKQLNEEHWKIGHSKIEFDPKSHTVTVWKGRNSKTLHIHLYNKGDIKEGSNEHYTYLLSNPADIVHIPLLPNSVLGMCMNLKPGFSLPTLVQKQYHLLNQSPSDDDSLAASSSSSRRDSGTSPWSPFSRSSPKFQRKQPQASTAKLSLDVPSFAAVPDAPRRTGIFSVGLTKKKYKSVDWSTFLDLSGVGDWCAFFFMKLDLDYLGTAATDLDSLNGVKSRKYGSNNSISSSGTLWSLNSELKNEKLAFKVVFDGTEGNLSDMMGKTLTELVIGEMNVSVVGDKILVFNTPYAYAVIDARAFAQGGPTLKDLHQEGGRGATLQSQSDDMDDPIRPMEDSILGPCPIENVDLGVFEGATEGQEPELKDGDYIAIAWGRDNVLVQDPKLLFMDAYNSFSFVQKFKGAFIVLKVVPYLIPNDSLVS